MCGGRGGNPNTFSDNPLLEEESPVFRVDSEERLFGRNPASPAKPAHAVTEVTSFQPVFLSSYA